MKHSSMRSAITLAVASALASLASGAAAQSAQRPTVLPEVSVSATRVERDNMDIPVSIDTIDQRTIREGNAQVNLSEALNRVPGIVVQNRQNYAQDLQISSRGFGARSTFGVRGLRLIADGIPATMPDGQGQAASFNLSSAKSIEVLRGPFASLYGNSAGGVVQIFTADGPKDPTLSLSAVYGSYDTYKLGTQYGGQHGPLNVVIDASRFETNGYRDHSGARRDHFNAKFKYDLGSAGVFTLVLNALDQPETEDPLGLTAAQVAQNPKQAGGNFAAGGANAINFNTRKSISQGQAGLTYDVSFSGNTKLNARVYFGDRQVTQHLAIPLATQNAFVSPGVRTHSGGVVDLDRGFGGAAVRVTHEAQLAGGPFTLSAGVDYDRMKERRRGFLNNLGVTGDLRRDEDNVVTNTDFYAQAEWQVIKDLSLMAGLRRSNVQFSSSDYFTLTNGNDSGAVDYARTTPAFGATYKITPTLNVYGNIGKGFETPTFAELAYRPGGGTGLNFALQPSNSLHREIGLKTLIGDNGRANVALFRVDVTNEIVVDTNVGGRSTFKNAPGTRRAVSGRSSPKTRLPGLPRLVRSYGLRASKRSHHGNREQRAGLQQQDRGRCHRHPRGCRHQLDPHQLDVADADGPGLLRHRADGHCLVPVRHRPVRGRGHAFLAAPVRLHDRGRHRDLQDGHRRPPDLRPDGRAQVGHRHGCLRELGRHVPQLRHAPGRGPHRAGRRVRQRLPPASRGAARRAHAAPDQGQTRTLGGETALRLISPGGSPDS